MAIVHHAVDLSNGQHVALKRMRPTEQEGRRAQLTALFELEYFTLSQLAHPRIVEVYDYGRSELGPWYTMELLDGGDLQKLAPLEWRRASAVARDVGSALSLLHSRRMVYRDLSPGNVRCTNEGLAKLIDFGAMTVMGPNREVVGTPPFVAPEALNRQPLDARTDLYALGATLYYALTGQNAYHARFLSQLQELWRVAPPPPSAFVANIPEALDRLVMELIHIDPASRPANAAEVMERLTAIAGLAPDEHLLVHKAYLATPTLVGRATQLSVIRDLTERALSQHGASVLIQGAAGSGRTRLLDACLLQAKLSGVVGLRADADDASEGDYGVVRALAAQLLLVAREPALARAQPYLALLGHILPELLELAPNIRLEPLREGELHLKLQPALRAWLLALSREQPLLIAVDDVPRIDEASLTLLTSLAQERSKPGLIIVAAGVNEELHSKERSPSLALLESASTALELAPLAASETQALLESVFGDVPHLRVLSHYVEQITAGNPRDVMQLTQHLVAENVIRYASGAWTLPDRLHGADLPSNMAEALRARIAKLSAHAHLLAYAFACEPKLRFTLDESLALAAEDTELTQQLHTLHELLASELILRLGPHYRVAHPGLAELLSGVLSSAEIVATHRRFARFFERQEDGLRSAQHLFRAGDEETGLDVLLLEAQRSRERTDVNPRAFFELLKTLPNDWLQTYDLGLSLCDRLARPRAQRDTLLSRLAGFVAHAVRDTNGFVYLTARLAQLSRDSGLDLLAQLPDSVAPGDRLRRALEQAALRYQQTPEHERVLDPGAAIKALASTVLYALGTIAFTNDYTAWLQLPSLAPLTPLSPALLVVHQLALGVGARLTGHNERSIATYEALLERLNQPDHAGLQKADHLTSVLRVSLSLGALEAGMGLGRCLIRADEVNKEPAYEIQAMMLRHLFLLWQGDMREAASLKQKLELIRALTSAHHGFDGQHLISELCAYALAEDLTRAKQASDAVAQHAEIHAAWVPVLHYGRGEYDRIRGDNEAALRQLELALETIGEGQHQIWANAAGARLRTLLELGREAEACALGEAYLDLAQTRGLGYVQNYVRMPLSLALCKRGDMERGVALAQTVVDEFEQLGSTGLNLAAAYEIRARVAHEARDPAAFEHFAGLCAAQWASGNKRLQRARYARITRRQPGAESAKDSQLLASELRSTLDSCLSHGQRIERGLEFLSIHSGAGGGVLYAWREGTLQRVGSFGSLPVDPALDDRARDYFTGRLADQRAVTTDVTEVSEDERPAKAPDDGQYFPVMFGHEVADGYKFTGLALLVLPIHGDLEWLGQANIELSRSLMEP